MGTVTVDWSLHPQVAAALGGVHVLHPAPDLSDEERRFIEFTREADRYMAGLPNNLSDHDRALVAEARVRAGELVDAACSASAHLSIDDLDHVAAITKEVMADFEIPTSFIERHGWDWLHDALTR